LIEALLSIRIPELWVTPITEKYDVELKCEVGGTSGKTGWGLATIKGNEQILDDIIKEVTLHPSVGSVKMKTRQPGSASFLVDVVGCKACEVLLRSKAFMVFPVHIHKGRMKWLIITDSNVTVGQIAKKLEEHQCDIKIERITPLREQGMLTERQEHIIRKAFESGYFACPRKTDATNLAKELKISASTLSEVIRAAQRRIFAAYLHS
jgi:predicted DNA binding protein